MHFGNTIYTVLGWTLIHSIWQIALFALVAFLILNSEVVKSARSRYVVLISSVFFIALAACLTFFLYYELIPYPHQAIDPLNLTGITSDINSNNLSPFSIVVNWVNQNLYFFTLSWMLGFLIYSFRLFGGIIYLNKLKKTAIPIQDIKINRVFKTLLRNSQTTKSVRIYLSNKVLSPITFGVYQASILLPLAHINKLSIEDTEIILAHELAHVIRNDFLVNIAVNLVGTMFYFHPAMWWLKASIDIEREKATDLLAAELSSSSALQYAKTLLAVQHIQTSGTNNEYPVTRHPALALYFSRTKKHLLQRVESILGKTSHKSRWIERVSALILFFGIFLLLSFTNIILPRKGKMVHPVFEHENVLDDKENSKNNGLYSMSQSNDSIQIKISFEDEGIELEGKEETNVEVTLSFDSSRPKKMIAKQKTAFVLPDSVFVMPEYKFIEKEFVIQTDEIEMDIDISELEGDDFFSDFGVFSFDSIYINYSKQMPHLKNQFYFKHKKDKHDQNRPFNSSKVRKIFDSNKMLIIESIEDSENDVFLWKEIGEKELKELPFYNQKFNDELMHKYKMDRKHLKHLEKEAIGHFETFHFPDHLPIEENRIIKIIHEINDDETSLIKAEFIIPSEQ